MPKGYYRFPTILGDTVVFNCEDDLWSVETSGGRAFRLTAGLGGASMPLLSPDLKSLTFTGFEEGSPEVYQMPIQGGQPQRLTFLGGTICYPASFTLNHELVIASNVRQPFQSLVHLYNLPLILPTQNPNERQVKLIIGQPQKIPIGPARSISYGANGGLVIGRNTADPARWKRYRGGTAGQIWIDETGEGTFHPLINLNGNLASPMWVKNRIFFLSDHEGIGNLYSCYPNGSDLTRHSHHQDYYARNASSDGIRIVYHAGGEIFLFDSISGNGQKVNINFSSPQTQRNRKFVSATPYLDTYHLHPNGHSLTLTARGKLFCMSNWEGAILQVGDSQDLTQTSIRYRLPHWLNDGERLIAVTDLHGEERFVIFSPLGKSEPVFLELSNIGRPIELTVNPVKDTVVFSNHRFELFSLNLTTQELIKIDRGRNEPVQEFVWSPDGEWLAYAVSISMQLKALKLWNVSRGEITQITKPVLKDRSPSFDPQGKYLYFLSSRVFDPVYDNVQFDAGFPRGERPYLIVLQKDLPNPFIAQPRHESAKPGEGENKQEDTSGSKPEDEQKVGSSDDSEKNQKDEVKKPDTKPIQIDLEGIQDRIYAFPTDIARYGQIAGAINGKVLYSSYPIEGALGENIFSTEPSAKGILWCYDFENLQEDLLYEKISAFDVSQEGDYLIYQSGYRLRVVKIGQKPEENSGTTRKSGWIDLNRIRVEVNPGAEWRQMFREAWRLQRDHFWTEDMSKIDWLLVHDRYLPLVDRVSSRNEFSDLVWEMQGELGTSHCYEFGGDYRNQPYYPMGMLGAEFSFNSEKKGWQVDRIAHGDAWDQNCDSPLK